MELYTAATFKKATIAVTCKLMALPEENITGYFGGGAGGTQHFISQAVWQQP